MPHRSWPELDTHAGALGLLAEVLHERLGQASRWHGRLDKAVKRNPAEPVTIEAFKPSILGLRDLRDLVDTALNEEMALAASYASHREIGEVLGISKQAASKRINKEPHRADDITKRATSTRVNNAPRGALRATKQTPSAPSKAPVQLADLVREFGKRSFVPYYAAPE